MALTSLNIRPASPTSPTPGYYTSNDPNHKSLQWLANAVEEGQAFIESQPGFDQIEKAIKAVMSEDSTLGPDATSKTHKLSEIRTNRIGKIAEDMAAMLTDTKPFWDYGVTNRRFEKHAENYGKLSTIWYQARNGALRVADLAQYYVVAGTSYLYKYYDPEIQDINCRALDPRDVLPYRPLKGQYDSLENCKGVIIRESVPCSYIKDRYGIDAIADGDGSSVSANNKARSNTADIASPIHRWANRSQDKDKTRIPITTLYTMFLKDDSKYHGEHPKEMGQFHDVLESNASGFTFNVRKPSNNWSYLVHPGEELYPNRRMIVWVANEIIYDGPSFYWHGRFPVLKFTLQPKPWSWFGKAPVWDLLKLQSSLNKLLRVVEDHANQVANPGSIHDKNSVTKQDYEKFNTRSAGWKLYQNPLAGKGIQIVNPPPLDSSIWESIKWIQDEMDTLSGTKDLSQMMKLNQLPNNDTVESIMASMTPGLRLRSRMMESFYTEWATQLAYDFTQFYTVTMRVTLLGPGSLTQDDYDFDPGTLMPDYIHDSDYDQTTGSITPAALVRGPLPRFDRAKEFLRRFTFKISPGSLLNAAQTEQKLIYLQLTRAGWMDVFTLWEALGIPNIGALPDDVHTIPERIVWQQQIGLSGEVNPAGRKASGQAQPRIVNKES